MPSCNTELYAEALLEIDSKSCSQYTVWLSVLAGDALISKAVMKWHDLSGLDGTSGCRWPGEWLPVVQYTNGAASTTHAPCGVAGYKLSACFSVLVTHIPLQLVMPCDAASGQPCKGTQARREL